MFRRSSACKRSLGDPRSTRSGKVSTLGVVLASNLVVLSLIGVALFLFWPRPDQVVQQANPPAAVQPAVESPAVRAPSVDPVATNAAESARMDNATSVASTDSANAIIGQSGSTDVATTPANSTPSNEPAPGVAANKKNTSTSEPSELSAVVSKAEKSVVLITTYSSDKKKMGFGSGFVIDDAGRIATNYHVLNGCTKATITYHDKTEVDATKLAAWNDRADLAILAPPDSAPQTAPLKLAEGELDRAAEVVAIGHPQGLKFTASNGIVSGVHRTDKLPNQFRQFLSAPDEQRWIQTTAALIGGSSGGPVLNNKCEAIGVSAWSASQAKLGFAVHVDHLRELMATIRETPAELTAITQPYLDMVRLNADFRNRFGWYMTEAEKLESPEERKALASERHPAPDFVKKLNEMATKNPESPIVFTCLNGVCRTAAMADMPEECREEFDKAATQLLSRFKNDKRMVRLAWDLQTSSNEACWKFLKSLLEQSSDNETRGIACLSLALAMGSGDDPGKHTDESLALLERVVTEFKDVSFGSETLGELAETQSYLIKNLAIGRPALEIVGQEADGTEFKLSEYRGKVVVLDFWADWCPHCVAMYPHEREMVQELADEPFALLGINTDDPKRLNALIKKKTVTWRNWSDGQGGPVAELYRVESYPTLFVLDHEGIIRYRDVRGEDLTEAVQVLLAKVPGRIAKPTDKPSKDESDKPADATRTEGTATPSETKK